jgi:N4-gp56 family major capsid protein
MADVLTTKTQVSATIETIVAAQVQQVLSAKMVVPGSISDYSSMVKPGMDTLKIPKFGKFTVGSKSAGTAVDAQTNAFSSDDLALSKHQVIQFLVEDLADLQSKLAITQEYVSQAASDMAAKMDADLITAMAASPSAAAPDHIIPFANTPTSTLGKADFLAARRLLNVQNVPLDDRSCLIGPASEADILAISEFVRVDESGSQSALRNGEIGKLFGFSVLMSSQASDPLFYHKSTHAYARQMDPRVQTENDLPNLAKRWSVDHIWGEKALDAGKRIVKING